MRTAYKGYLIVQGFNGEWHISQDGFHISTQPTLELAKRQVDAIVD